MSEAYAIEHPFVEPCGDSAARLSALPRQWDRIAEDVRRHLDAQLSLFAGLRDYYAAADAWLEGQRGIAGFEPPAYAPDQQLRLELPSPARERAAQLAGAGAIAVMPAGSGPRPLYPSVEAWSEVLDALPPAPLVLVGKLVRDGRTTSSFGAHELQRLLAHRPDAVNAFDLPLMDQLAIVERCGLFVSPHTGFGLAALAVARHGWRSPAGAGSSGSSTAYRSAPSSRTPSATRASPSSTSLPSWTVARPA